jgi:hypothetical protein
MHHFLDDERLRNHADDVAAVFERRVRQNAHQSDTTAAINQFDSAFGQLASEVFRRFGIGGAGALVRTAKNGDAFHFCSAWRTLAMNARTFAWSFFPGARFHAAGNVHAKRPHLAHGGGDIFRRQSAGEKNRFAKFLRFDGQVPVEFFAGAAEVFGRAGVEQPGVGGVFRQLLQRFGVADAEGFHAHHAKLRAKFRRFVAVKLEQAQAAFRDGAENKFLRRVHKNANAHDERRQLF